MKTELTFPGNLPENNKAFQERKKWFEDRIGKRVFRNKNGCSCNVCEFIYQNGLVLDKESGHWEYVFDSECNYTAEGTPLRYFDTESEVYAFEKSLIK